MVQTSIKKSDTSMNARDLQLCQEAFNAVKTRFAIDADCEEAERIAAITVELYRQGVHNPDHLKAMVEGARGLFDEKGDQPA
jgi:hypothetical protein